MMDSASQLLVLLTQALAKLWAKWKCMSNSNNLHKP